MMTFSNAETFFFLPEIAAARDIADGAARPPGVMSTTALFPVFMSL